MNNNKLHLKIPPDIEDFILPRKTLSVMEFLQFPLPNITQKLTASTTYQSETFFSALAPTITDPQVIRRTLLPPLSILESLSQISIPLGTQSIICRHAQDDRFPVWILAYWAQVAQAVSLKRRWSSAEEALEVQKTDPKCTTETKNLINQVCAKLASISWSGSIQGFSCAPPIDVLTSYLTKDWLTDEHENQMMYLLDCELARRGQGEGVHVPLTYLVTRLCEVYHHPNRDEYYATAKNNRWLRQRGQELGTGVFEKLPSIINLGQNHWVAIVINATSSKILYGDSFGYPIPKDLVDTLTWWTYQHTRTIFNVDTLAITCQEDQHNCGMLAWNAIAAHLLPEAYSLMDSQTIADEQLKVFLQVVERHNEKAFQAEAQGYEFTFGKQLSESESTDSDMDVDETGNDLLTSCASSIVAEHSQPATPLPSSSAQSVAYSPTSSSFSLGAPVLPGQKRAMESHGSVPSASSQTEKIGKPAKKVIISAIRIALKLKDEAKKLGKETPQGLLSFWHKGTEAEKKFLRCMMTSPQIISQSTYPLRSTKTLQRKCT